tara:strand:+ start:108 stop:257 length:150 start_codon:yes stop_codon:yes gene_type:complete
MGFFGNTLAVETFNQVTNANTILGGFFLTADNAQIFADSTIFTADQTIM